MNLIKKLLGEPNVLKGDGNTAPSGTPGSIERRALVYEREICKPLVAEANFLTLAMTLPEVFFPIDFIASRISKAHFEIKKTKDDSVVWCNRRMTRILANPNCLMGWSELIYTHFFYKLPTGNAYIRAAMGDASEGKAKYRWCDTYWPVTAPSVTAVPKSYRLPIYGVCGIDDLIKHYEIRVSQSAPLIVPTNQIWHDRDLPANLHGAWNEFLKSESRLKSAMRPISNLIAVYEARNVIYVKRGGIGFLVSQKRDVTGSVAMTAEEKKQVRDHLTSDYGVGRGQSPIGISDIPMNFVRTNLSIQELMPFEETLEDAIKIAGVFGIPDVLVPRRDHSTFSNQATAEKSVYSGVIIPMAKKFCQDFTTFLGLEQDGLYLDCDFSDVDCLQVGLKEAEEVKKLVNDRCESQFANGLITLNDWRAQIHESQISEEEMPLFSKLKYQMSDEELATVERMMPGKAASKETNNNTIENNEREEPKLAF